MKKTVLFLAIVANLAITSAHAADQTSTDSVSVDELRNLVKQQHDELEMIKARLAKFESTQQNQQSQIENQVREKSTSNETAKTDSKESSNSFGGYGEVTYSNYKNNNEFKDQADITRFVLYFGHQFNDRLRFNSEVEWEHGVTSADDPGEVEIEQAYIDYRFSDAVNLKTGLFLIPMGLLNEKHEPPNYYGVFRNEVETRIIPTTWREGGIGFHGALGSSGFEYDVGLTTGFDVGKLDDPSEGIRSAHQELTLSSANDLSTYAALNYRAPGLLLGASIFTGNTGQNGSSNADLKDVNARLTLWDIHAQYRIGGFDLQALYARGSLGDALRVNAALLAAAEENVTEPFAVPRTFSGWYVQGAYRFELGTYTLAPFIRYERYDIKQQEDAFNGLFQDPANKDTIATVGLNFYLDPQVVFKFDYQDHDTNSNADRFNLGVGYSF